ncbi:MAG: hypothetical protein LV481_10235 [Methylacidiphilales bacterium]|nr:hypothetical protein [Candidatus Methylacidiphilales bacterium]
MAISTKSRTKEADHVTVNFSDSIDLIHDQIHWSPKGVSLLTKWPFAEGTEIEFAFDHRGERHCCTGVVVSCDPLRRPAGYFEVVLFFVETPCTKLQKAASACRLAREEESRAREASYVNTLNGADHFSPRSRARNHAG